MELPTYCDNDLWYHTDDSINNVIDNKHNKHDESKIPHGKFALIFLDDRDMILPSGETIQSMFSSRQEPMMFSGLEDTTQLQDWLCDPLGSTSPT